MTAQITWFGTRRPDQLGKAPPQPDRRFAHVKQFLKQRRSVTGGQRHCAACADGGAGIRRKLGGADGATVV
jgi:hypothetical protein